MSAKFTKREMQVLLPDYLFDRLTIEDKQKFEDDLKYHEDIKKELESAQSVFGKLKKMDIDSYVSKKTRNLSVRVNDRLHGSKSSYRRKHFIRVIAPAVAVLLAAIFLIDIFDARISKVEVENDIDRAYDGFQITSNDINIVFADDNNDKRDANYSDTELSKPDILSFDDEMHFEEEKELVDDLINEMMDNLFDDIGSVNKHEMLDASFFGHDIYSELKGLSNEEFEKLIEEVKSEKII